MTAPVTGSEPSVAASPLIASEDPTTGMAASVAGRPPDVEILDVTKRFGDVVAVDQMTLRIARGEFYSFLGPSGCGKTTTLRMIAGLRAADGRRDPARGRADRRRAAVPPQRQHGLPALRPVPAHGRRPERRLRPAPEARQAGRGEAARVGGARARPAGRLRGRRTWEMSGGQQQRVALARALVNHPTVLLLDEPLGALDLKLRKEMQLELKDLQREVGITFVYVTHDQEEALTMSDVIVVMQRRPDPAAGRSDRALRAAGQPVRRQLHRRLEPDRRPLDRARSGDRHGAVEPTRGLRLTRPGDRPRAAARRSATQVDGRDPARALAVRAGGRRRAGGGRLDARSGPDQPGHVSRRPDRVPDRRPPPRASSSSRRQNALGAATTGASAPATRSSCAGMRRRT